MSDHDTWNMFAAAALQGMLASPHLADHIKNVGSPPTTMDTYDYVAIAARAYADALLAESKKREPVDELDTLEAAIATPPQPDDGWIKWEGGAQPCHNDTIIELDGILGRVLASHVNWNWRFRYRIVSEAGVTK